MSKADSLRVLVRIPECGDTVEIETATGWECVHIVGGTIPNGSGGIYTQWTVEFDDGSHTQVTTSNINWRWPAK